MAEQNITDKTMLDKVRGIVTEQLQTSLRFKQPRMKEITQTEDILAAKPRPALRNRFNVPFDSTVLQGARDTILAKSDDKPLLVFEETQEEGKRAAMKIQAAFDRDSSDAVGHWAQKDRLAKTFAFSSGRAIFETYAESDPKYRNVRKVIDHFDFHCEPGGGPVLENHLFCGTVNNFIGHEALIARGNSGRYIAEEVQKLQGAVTEEMRKEMDDDFKNVHQRYMAMGLDISQHTYVGSTLYNFAKFQTTIEGERYYVLFEPRTQCIVRLMPLKEMFESELYSYTSWATHEDSVFWSRGYGDSYRPIAEVYRVLVNQMLENIQKRNWNNRAYDPQVFTNPEKLLYSPDGLAKANLKPGMTSVAQGIFTFETPDTVGVTLNTMEWLNGFAGQHIGVTPGAQGVSEQTKVGIYYGDMQQVADRFGLLNKSYTQEQIDAGTRYDWGLYEHLPEDFAVEIMGIDGVGWEKLVKDDVKHDFKVSVKSLNATAQEDDMKAKKRATALAAINADPELRARVNPSWRIEQTLKFGEFTEEEIRVAMDTKNDGTQLVLAKAAECIRAIVDGEKSKKKFEYPPLVRQATTGFMQKIIDYADDHFNDIEKITYDRLNIFALAHQQLVMENMARKAMFESMMQPAVPIAPGKPVGGGAPAAPAGMTGV